MKPQPQMTTFFAASAMLLEVQIKDTDHCIERMTEHRAMLKRMLVDIVANLDATHGERGSLDELLALLVAHRPIAAEHGTDARELRRRCATSAPPAPIGVRPDLSRPMTYVDAVTLARQFLGLYEMPDANDAAWRGAIAKTGIALALELVHLFEEAYDDGTPIAGAGCT
jgi:hypothetical protein